MIEITKKLAQFVRDIRFSDIPPEALEHGKKCILDCLGSGLGGIQDDASRLVIEYVSEMGGKPHATVMGTALQTDVASAALANGVIAHALDFDDYHGDTVIHGTAACLPAILAIAESRHLSGADVLAALIVSIDMSVRLALGLGRYHYELC